jgi:hypothetical protein
MNNENEDRELKKLFWELSRTEANRTPPFSRVCPALTPLKRTPRVIYWRRALGMALATVAVIAVSVIFRHPASVSSQADAAALAAAALQIVMDLPDESPSLAWSDSPTAFLLSSIGGAPGSEHPGPY